MEIRLQASRALLAAALSVGAANADAGAVLDAQEIRDLIVGKTVTARHQKKGFEFKVYFGEDGRMVRLMDGETSEAPYEITSDGRHCVTSVTRGNRVCARIEANGDGTYDRVLDSGKRPIRWSGFEPGKTF